MKKVLENVYSPSEVARMLKVCEATIRAAINKGKLDAYQLSNGHYVVDNCQLKAYLDNHKQKKPLTEKQAA